MVRLTLSGAVLLFYYLSAVSARRLQDGRLHGNVMRPATVPLVSAPAPDVPVVSKNGTVLPPYNTTYYFDQLIDHNNPSLGTFKQRFWHTWEFYEPGETRTPLNIFLAQYYVGGVIVLSTPGEGNADGEIFDS